MMNPYYGYGGYEPGNFDQSMFASTYTEPMSEAWALGDAQPDADLYSQTQPEADAEFGAGGMNPGMMN